MKQNDGTNSCHGNIRFIVPYDQWQAAEILMLESYTGISTLFPSNSTVPICSMISIFVGPHEWKRVLAIFDGDLNGVKLYGHTGINMNNDPLETIAPLRCQLSIHG